MSRLYPVYTLKNECHDCYKCIRECHIKAIKIRDGSASVIDDKCIACGHCVKVCPSGAKRYRNDVEKIKAMLIRRERIYVSLAPSWSGVYDMSAGKMIAVLKKLGFAGVGETALGAQEVSIKDAEILRNARNGLFISSACPVICDYIRMYKPHLAKHITPVASPALTHAKLLKKYFGDDIKVVFIGPCIAKKNEADDYPDCIDAAITFEELNLWINEEFIRIDDIQETAEDVFEPRQAYEGALYPLEGGMNDTIRLVGIDDDTSLISISGLETFDRTLDGFDASKLTGKVFIEALSCDSGCINGPGINTDKAGLAISAQILSKTKKRESIPQNPEVVFKREYNDFGQKNRDVSFENIEAAMKRIGKLSPDDELNCGGCGYHTCRDMASALVRGEAEVSMCVSYMRQLAARKTAAMLRSMPSAVVIVDKNLKIEEANDSFVRMFCKEMQEFFAGSKDGIAGASLDAFVSFGDIFRTLLLTGGDIQKAHYPEKGKLYNINAFTIEEGEMVGAVIADVTKEEFNREQVAAKAREVITKNISKVQQIAMLLGEHMVETETLLEEIAEDYSVPGESSGKE